MNLEIKERSKVEAVIYGQKVTLKKPTIGQIERLQADMKSTEGKENIAVMKKFGTELGLPLDMCDSLEVDHFLELIEHLTASKKK
jgi:hypothetical protein